MDALRWVWRLGFGLALSFTIAVSLLPQSEMPPHNVSDKLGHFLTYFALGLSGALALSRLRRTYFLALLVFLACVLEFLQILVPGRSPGFSDALASSLGAAAGILVVSVLRMTMSARGGKAS